MTSLFIFMGSFFVLRLFAAYYIVSNTKCLKINNEPCCGSCWYSKKIKFQLKNTQWSQSLAPSVPWILVLKIISLFCFFVDNSNFCPYCIQNLGRVLSFEFIICRYFKVYQLLRVFIKGDSKFWNKTHLSTFLICLTWHEKYQWWSRWIYEKMNNQVSGWKVANLITLTGQPHLNVISLILFHVFPINPFFVIPFLSLSLSLSLIFLSISN